MFLVNSTQSFDDHAPASATPKPSATPKVSPPKATRKTRGDKGETFAAEFLEARGFQVVARNWRPSGGAGRELRGELDLVAWLPSRGVLCFVEVKTRSNAQSAPQEAVTRAKQKQISRLALAFVARELAMLLPQLGVTCAPDDVPCRFDVMEVWLRNEVPARANFIENAFDFCE